MLSKITVGISALIIGFFAGIFTTKNYIAPLILRTTIETPVNNTDSTLASKKINNEVIGFLPYWLLTKADKDYSQYLTTLSYFSLTIAADGRIQKQTKPGETEPGYHTLKSGKMDNWFKKAKSTNLKLSLVVFTADDENITTIVSNPATSAQNLVEDVLPIMDLYGFTDLNIDVEQVKDASPEERNNFIEFVKQVDEKLSTRTGMTVSIDVVASSFVKNTNLADPVKIAPFVDQIIIMAYDYHHIGSMVTGAVAPGQGAGTVSEYDTEIAVKSALQMIPSEKIVLGIPLYGYEWETIRDTPRSAIIPGTGQTISNRRAEELETECKNCTIAFDETDKENHLLYKISGSGNYYQAFYPNKKSTQYKVDIAKQHSLGGIALWALGYEGNTILEPLSAYRY